MHGHMYTLTGYIPGPSCLSWGERPGDKAIIDSCAYVTQTEFEKLSIYKPHELIRQGMPGFRDITIIMHV